MTQERACISKSEYRNLKYRLEKHLPQVNTVELPVETLLEYMPVGAALILPDKKILRINSHLAEMIGSPGERPCHEVLAGLPEVCPFCPFEELISGARRSIRHQSHFRRGRECLVNLHFLSNPEGQVFILETVSTRDSSDRAWDTLGASVVFPGSAEKLSGLLSISRELLVSAPFPGRMINVLRHISSSLSDESNAVAWVELDGKVFGRPAQEGGGILAVHEVEVEGQLRGYLKVRCPEESGFSPEDQYFLQESAELIGRQLAISDLEAKLRKSEEKYKRLARNLAKEVWRRTEALAKETVYLAGILKSSDDMIITTDLEGRIVEFNPAAERILGYSVEEVQGRKVSDVWVVAQEREEIMREVNASGGIRNYMTLLRAKSGEIREISLTLSQLKDSEGNLLGTVGVSKDVSRENAIRRELERLNRNYRETMHFINHETKNSLIVIGGFARRLLETETDRGRADQLQVVYHHAKFLEAMTGDYLIMAELEHGEFQVRKDRIDNFYEEVILPAMIGLKERYPDSFESYDQSMGGVGAISLLGNRGLLETVYRNLFGNALKYRSPEGKIAYGVIDKGDRYQFNVWNAGPGVAPEQVEKIFDKFYRVPDETTRQKRGTGLGLYNIRKIIEGHGGKIWCVSVPGQWINFIFELPKK